MTATCSCNGGRTCSQGGYELDEIVKDELTARVRSLDREGWRDLRETAARPSRGPSGP